MYLKPKQIMEIKDFLLTARRQDVTVVLYLNYGSCDECFWHLLCKCCYEQYNVYS